MTRDMHQPHDRLFRKVFSEPAEAAGLLRAHVPSWLADTLNWSSLTLMNDSYVDETICAPASPTCCTRSSSAQASRSRA